MTNTYTTIDTVNDYTMEFMTVKYVADTLQISDSTCYKLFSSEGFPAIQIQHQYRVEKRQFAKWCNDYAGRKYQL